MAICAIVGINWGDEGKGRMVDYLADRFEVVVRYQGGNNAGHTVINEYGKFALNLLPSGIFHRETVNLLGVGTVIDPEAPVPPKWTNSGSAAWPSRRKTCASPSAR